MEVQNKKIAFIDSGVGGLTVFSKMKELLPNENYIYFGDLKNSPYGNKSKDELVNITKKIFDYFQELDVKAVVMACNTTSANVYDTLKDNYNYKIYPIIQTCAKEFSKLEKVCVFATSATVSSHAWQKYIKMYNPKAQVLEISCPTWVKIVEEERIYEKDSEQEIKKYLNKAMEHAPENIILGCTHYPYLLDILCKFADKNIFINPAEIFAQKIIADLSQNSMLTSNTVGSEQIMVTAMPKQFKNASKMFYKTENLPQKIDL